MGFVPQNSVADEDDALKARGHSSFPLNFDILVMITQCCVKL